ncbi:vault protein inter-alpha-trypsin domain-containing protein [Gaertneriomyces semiglobifer]|nr:vault protein inter-alpha-trypsin domain-containing protein [Gaertneriomyces semiglobifer]
MMYGLIVVHLDQPWNCNTVLPLQRVHVQGEILDTAAKVHLTQVFLNTSTKTEEVVYKFPLHEGAVVSAFEATIGTTVIKGVVKEKEEARKEYEKAKSEGLKAGLIDQQAEDVFQCTVGNVPPKTSVQVRLTYYTELYNDVSEADQVRFTLPTAIAPRYGDTDLAFNDTASSNVQTSLDMELVCKMQTNIEKVTSPSHEINVQKGENANQTTVILSTVGALERDITVLVKAVSLDAPKCLIEEHPITKSHAVSLTFAPRFNLTPLTSTELVFLIDRSGSMEGSRIQQASQALSLFLRSIPVEKHFFNIIGFGSSHKALFDTAVEYNHDTFKQADMYARRLKADMGGTEIENALRETFARRKRDIPLQVFLVTDGDVWGLESLMEMVRVEVKNSSKEGFVRVFTLGVGEAASSALVEGVARVGGGFSQRVMEGERMESKVMRMLKGALSPPIGDVRLEWDGVGNDMVVDDVELVEMEDANPGATSAEQNPVSSAPPTTTEPMSLFQPDLPADKDTAPKSLPTITSTTLQSPFHIPPMFPGIRFTVYAFLPASTTLPSKVTLRGMSLQGPVELVTPVPTNPIVGTTIHTLFAKSLIKDMTDGKSYIHALLDAPTHQARLQQMGIQSKGELTPANVDDIVKREVVQLGIQFAVANKYVSWVAIENRDGKEKVVAPGVPDEEEVGPQVAFSKRGGAPSGFKARIAMSSGPPPSGFGGSAKRMVKSMVTAMAPRMMHAGPAPQLLMQQSVCPPPMPSPLMMKSGGYQAAQSTAFMGAPSLSMQPLQMDSAPMAELAMETDTMECFAAPTNNGRPKTPSTPMETLHAILDHLNFSGLFNHQKSADLARITGLSVSLFTPPTPPFKNANEESALNVWTTVVMLTFVRKRLGDMKEEWEFVIEKSERAVEKMLPTLGLTKEEVDVAANNVVV